jgi:hypothetical protein
LEQKELKVLMVYRGVKAQQANKVNTVLQAQKEIEAK